VDDATIHSYLSGEPKADAMGSTADSKTPALNPTPNAPKKVLVVDDDQPLCKMAAIALQEGGYRTFMAFTGGDALKIYKAELPDVVVLDIAMPGMNGFEVVSEIRKMEPPDKHTIIVIMTAYARSYQVADEFEAGIDSYLTKPILPLDLIAHVSSLIG
jgi:CheY-like chemotaxis protein